MILKHLNLQVQVGSEGCILRAKVKAGLITCHAHNPACITTKCLWCCVSHLRASYVLMGKMPQHDLVINRITY